MSAHGKIGSIPVIVDPSDSASATVILAHGAGAGMDSWFMNELAAQLQDCQFRVVRFEFPYMQQRRETGTKRPPQRMPALLEYWLLVLDAVRAEWPDPIIIGGKSMGGRAASMLIAETDRLDGVTGCACFGYPFHPQSQPQKTRVEHLQNTLKPVLICQGTRDSMGKPDEVSGYCLGSAVTLSWLDSADHDFKPLKRSGSTQTEMIEQAASALSRWFGSL